MGVDRYDYLVLGWKMKQEIFDRDFLIDLQSCQPDNIFFNTESDHFAVYGKLVASSNCIIGFDLLEIDASKEVMRLEGYDKLTSNFRDVTAEELQDWTDHGQAKLYLFSILG